MSLLDHELLLLPVEEFKEYVVDSDAELDYSRSDIDPSFHTIQKRSSEDKVQIGCSSSSIKVGFGCCR